MSQYFMSDMPDLVGRELGVTDWLEVRQDLVNGFGASTFDLDWMHIDPERAARESPFGGPIAFGFWTLSMLTYFSHNVGMWPQDAAIGLNYGLDRVRWINPVKIGARIRMRCTLRGFELREDGGYLIRTSNIVELEDGRPALAAEWLGVFYPQVPV